MWNTLVRWYHRYFSDEEAVVLLVLILSSFGIIYAFGEMLAPVFVALVLAYLMQGLVSALTKHKVPEGYAVASVFLFFVGCLAAFMFVVLPLVWTQSLNVFNEQLPQLLNQGQDLLLKLPEQYPQLVTTSETEMWLTQMKGTITSVGEELVSISFSKLPSAIGILIYLILVPVLVFFFMKDREVLINQFLSLLPKERETLGRVWREMDEQIANYVRGKVVEIVIVGIVTYVALLVLGVDYAELLGVLVGLSVVVPYIGAALVTIPVAVAAYFQFGIGSGFYTVMVVYGVIQALDGNVLVPLLFSEAVNLHPVVIIIAVLLFGGLWGLWGVFFAIPLATLVKAVVNAWPKRNIELGPVEGAVNRND